MKTLFFPQTLIEPALAEVLATGFGPLTLLHPAREALDEQTAALAETNRCELVFPCQEDAAVPSETFEALRRWAAEHAGQDLAGLLRRAPDIPFFDADASARIAAEVKSGPSPSPVATAAQRLQRARLLLIMAQEFDRSQRELTTDFRRLEDQERQMMALLKGEVELPDAGELGAASRAGGPPPLYMLAERLGAWAQLALAAGDVWAQDPVTWFLTDDRGVLAQVTDQGPTEILLDGYLDPGAFETLRDWLTDPQGPPPCSASPGPSASPGVQLTLVGLPQLSTDRWLQRLAGAAVSPTGAPNRSAPLSVLRVAYAAIA